MIFGTMHLKYPRKKDHYSWEELRCLAKALGFRKDLFYKNIPPEVEKEKLNGLNIKLLLYMLDIKCLHGDIHRTYNMHDALYNSRVIEKAIGMVSSRYLSFQELREARVAFQLYEHEDMLGLATDDHTLLRTLKICGRAVSPAKLKQHIKHMEKQVPDRLMMYEFLDLLLLCERETDLQLQPAPNVSGVDKNNLFKLCDFQAVLSTEDDKKIRHLDSLYKQGSVRVVSDNQKEIRSWRLQQEFFVDSNPRIELVSRQQQRSVELCDHLSHSNKKVMHARCGFLGTSKSAGFVDLNDMNRRLKPLARHPARLELLLPKENQDEILEREVVGFEPPENEQEIEQSKAAKIESASSGSEKFYSEFNGTTSSKLSRTSKAGHQRILVSPRDLHNSHMMSQNLMWDIETQSQRLKQRMERQMREKYADYYKKLQRFQESVSPHEMSGIEDPAGNKLKESPQADSHLTHEQDSTPVEFVITPRKQAPRKDSIYKCLMSRLHKTNSLLVFGDVRVQEPGATELRYATSDSQLARPRPCESTKRTSEIQSLGSFISPRPEKTADDRAQDDEVEHLLEKLQEANYIASGRRGFTDPKQSIFAK